MERVLFGRNGKVNLQFFRYLPQSELSFRQVRLSGRGGRWRHETGDSIEISVVTGENDMDRFIEIFAPYVKGVYIALQGIGMTLGVTAGALVLGMVVGLIMALGKLSKHKIARWPASLYVEIIRGTPLFVQILILAYGVPYMVSTVSGGAVRFNWQPIFVVGIIACGLNSGAYLAEIMRSGIQAVDKGQTEAARSLGMTNGQNMRYIVLPQALKIILPAMANEFVTLIKETSILSYVGIVEITRQGVLWASREFETFPAYIGVAVVYLCMTIPLSRLVAYLEKRMSSSSPAQKKRKAGM